MYQVSLFTVLMAVIVAVSEAQNACKNPYVERRLLLDDATYASPFYVIALPRSAKTEQMDNICYSYFKRNDAFFHIMSITGKDGTNTFYKYNKGDIADRMGVAEAQALENSQCTYHDYTLKPVCNNTVFILYRCFISDGPCNSIDVGKMPGVDVRVVLAASTSISDACRQETAQALKDTSVLDGGDYVFLPQKLKRQCITKYNNELSIGSMRAEGSKEATDADLTERFGGETQDTQVNTSPAPQQGQAWPAPVAGRPAVSTPTKNTFNPYGTNVGKPGSSYSGNPQNRPAYTPAPAWTHNNGQWNPGPSPWNGQTLRPGTESHFHMWQSPTAPTKTTAGKNPNVYYHIHRWENPPPGCCRCN